MVVVVGRARRRQNSRRKKLEAGSRSEPGASFCARARFAAGRKLFRREFCGARGRPKSARKKKSGFFKNEARTPSFPV